jgi:retinol dehydrogenase-16
MKPWGVKVVIMEPGGYSTAIFSEENKKKMWKKQWDDLSTEMKDEYGDEYFEKGTLNDINVFDSLVQ